MTTVQGTGEYTRDVTVASSATAASGTFLESLTISGSPVITALEFVEEVFMYTGTGISGTEVGGTQVVFSGINRTHAMYFMRHDLLESNQWPYFSIPNGDTGDVFARHTNGGGFIGIFDLDAPEEGLDQTLLVTTTGVTLNAVGVPYHVYVIGTPAGAGHEH